MLIFQYCTGRRWLQVLLGGHLHHYGYYMTNDISVYFNKTLSPKEKEPLLSCNSQAELSDEAFAPVHSGLFYIQTA